VNGNEPRIGADAVVATAAALRRSFDESFAVAATSKLERLEGLLAIRVGGDPYALRLSQISGLYADRRIVGVPSPVVELLGIVRLRGSMLPVYDLAALLQYPPAASPRWMVVAGGSQQPIGFAFEGFDAHVQVAEASLVGDEDRAESAVTTRQHVRGNIRVAGALRLVIQIASVVETIRNNHS
jgi:chemotaxis signal transduction protein